MPYLHPSFWRFNVLTQQYQQTNTWFLRQSTENSDDFSHETYDFSQESDAFSYITQESDSESDDFESSPFKPSILDFDLLKLYFDSRFAASAA